MGFVEVRGSGKSFFDFKLDGMICVTLTAMVFVPQLGRLLSAEKLCTFQGLLLDDFFYLQIASATFNKDLAGNSKAFHRWMLTVLPVAFATLKHFKGGFGCFYQCFATLKPFNGGLDNLASGRLSTTMLSPPALHPEVDDDSNGSIPSLVSSSEEEEPPPPEDETTSSEDEVDWQNFLESIIALGKGKRGKGQGKGKGHGKAEGGKGKADDAR